MSPDAMTPIETTTLRARCVYVGWSSAIFISHSEPHQIRLRVDTDEHAKQLHDRDCEYDIELRGARDEDGAFVDAHLLALEPVIEATPAETRTVLRAWGDSVELVAIEEHEADRAAERTEEER